MRPIGYYVHHQGAGHWQRARRVAELMPRSCRLIGTLAQLDGRDVRARLLDLPDDRMDVAFDGRDGAADRPEGLHYAPLGHPGIRDRMAAIAGWIQKDDPVLLVVDVSVEVAILARLLSLPTIVFRLAGSRTDRPHLEAFRAAERIVAPFPEALEDPAMPDWVRAKTFYAGFLADSGPAVPQRGRDIAVVLGRGGEAIGQGDLASAARAVPDRVWNVFGRAAGGSMPADLPANLVLHGWVDDVPARIAGAGLVIGAAGDGVVAAAAWSGAPFLCLPEPRGYDEQTSKAAALARLGAAIVHEGWPAPDAWPALVKQALALDPARLHSLVTPDALMRLAAEIEATTQLVEARARPGAA